MDHNYIKNAFLEDNLKIFFGGACTAFFAGSKPPDSPPPPAGYSQWLPLKMLLWN